MTLWIKDAIKVLVCSLPAIQHSYNGLDTMWLFPEWIANMRRMVYMHAIR